MSMELLGIGEAAFYGFLAAPPILAQGRGIRHLVGQLQSQIPTVGRVALHLTHQLPLAANTKQISEQQQLEQHHRIQRRSPVIFTSDVPTRRKSRSMEAIDLAQQMV